MNQIKTLFLSLFVIASSMLFSQTQNALDFDGVDDYVDCGNDASLDITGPVTVEAWIYRVDHIDEYQRIVEKDWSSSYFLGSTWGLNGITFSMDANGSTANVLETGPNVVHQYIWTHIAGTWDGSVLKIYINGELEASKLWTNIADGSTKNLLIGKYYGNSDKNFEGYIDEVRIWKEARTIEEIRSNMYKELDNPAIEANLVAYYPLNEGSGQTSADMSINSNTAILGGTASVEPTDPAWITSTAPMPYKSFSNGIWQSVATWVTGQGYPFKTWAIVEIDHHINTDADDAATHVKIGPSGILTIGAGYKFNLNGHMLVEGIYNMESSAIMNNNDGSSIEIEDGGRFETFGTSGSEVAITHNASGYYSFLVNEGGTLASEYTLFEYMDIDGLYIEGAIDPSYPLSYCTFQQGESTGTLLYLESDQTITLSNINFPTNTWGGDFNVTKSVDQGMIEFDNAQGGFSGGIYEDDPFDRITWGGYETELIVFLEGPYNGLNMDAGINDILPLSQPYNTSPWNYSGTESVISIPDVNTVDWVLVELRDAVDAASAIAGTVVERQAGFLKADGNITALDGTSNLRFTSAISDDLFVVIWHRNHLGILAANPAILNSGVYAYDFTTTAQIYGTATGYSEVASGVFALASGDANADGFVNNSDKISSWESEAGTSGYISSDLNMDSQSNNIDKNEFWFNNDGKGTEVPN